MSVEMRARQMRLLFIQMYNDVPTHVVMNSESFKALCEELKEHPALATMRSDNVTLHGMEVLLRVGEGGHDIEVISIARSRASN